MAERGGDFAGDVAEVEQRYRRGIQQIPLALQAVEIPVIAAVNGPAIGAGFDLANMADIRIASEKAKFGETFLNLGLTPDELLPATVKLANRIASQPPKATRLTK